MLDFWYSERCSRQIKTIVSILTCAIIYYCSTFEKISPIFTLICLLIGISIHLLRNLSLKVDATKTYKQSLKILTLVFPIIAVIIIIYLLPAQNKMFTSVQAIGFVAFGLFIVSIYENRQKRVE